MSRNVSIVQLGPAARAQVVAKIGAQEALKRSSKYGNRACVVDGLRFDSQKEAQRYVVLKAEQGDGEIRDLRVQPAFRIQVGGKHICDYVADFDYMRRPDRGPWVYVCEDVKSKATMTGVYKLKKKLLWATHGIEITEV